MNAEQYEKHRLARWLSVGEVWPVLNAEDFSDWDYGTEPVPGDQQWAKKKAPEGAFDDQAASSHSGSMPIILTEASG